MLSKLLIAWSLTALCVMLHAVGMTGLLRWVNRAIGRIGGRFWFTTLILVRTAGWIILLHLIEIAVWAFFYTWRHGLPDLPSAFYFSSVTYTTTGYGDLVLPNEWRLVGGVEALTGILMCGWSAAFFFAVVTRLNETRSQPARA
ncbi:MAG TPA: potassium channel family protein [Chthoniobacterales bacterium]|nr:potassium channel family protein [Chthoniobacterales bacterium]